MAQISHSQSMAPPVAADRVQGRLPNRHSLALRRLLAWGLEVSVLLGSAAVPWGLGEAVRQRVEANPVPLNPAARMVQTGVARTFGWPRSRLIETVPVATNVLWFSGVLLPLALAGGHIHQLAKTGKSWPKACLGLQVVTVDSAMPGYARILLREGVGRLGCPLGVAYLVWLGSGLTLTGSLGGGLVLTSALALGATGGLDRSRRAVHDYLAGTKVLLLRGGQLAVKHTEAQTTTVAITSSPDLDVGGGKPTVARVAQRLFPFAQTQLLTMTHEEGGLRALVLSPLDEASFGRPWLRRPWLWVGVAGLTLALVVGLGLRRQGGSDLLGGTAQAPSDDLFLALVKNLSLEADTFQDRQAATLALASSRDPRAVTLLVDLLAQTSDPALLDTLQQALVTLGPLAIPHLQRLNLTLANDMATLPPNQRLKAQLRQRTVKRTLAKIVLIYNDQLQGTDLHGVQLAQVREGPDAFTLVLEGQNLAGLIWTQAVLSGAQLRQARLFDPGPDGRHDTFDDWVADVSGADLTEASLVATQLRHVLFRRASLLRADLSNAQAQYADFSGANASSARFIATVATEARFQGTSLVGADLTEAQLDQADFREARLREASLVGASLHQANLARADLSTANLQDSHLIGANLRAADLRNSRLTQANLENANLENANLENATLQDAVLTGANLDGANLRGATFVASTAPTGDGFIAVLPETEAGTALVSVDFSRAMNLDADQLAYICQQGGIHPQCGF